MNRSQQAKKARYKWNQARAARGETAIGGKATPRQWDNILKGRLEFRRRDRHVRGK